MKKYVITTLILCFSFSCAYSLPGFDLGIFGGLSTPNDQIAEVYTPKSGQSAVDLVHEGAKSGFHIGAKVRIGLSEKLNFVGSIAWHHLPETKTDVQLLETGGSVLPTMSLASKQEIIPFSAGIDYSLINLGLVRWYAIGDLAYNYFSNTVDIPDAYQNMINGSKTSGRVGAGIGTGVDFNVKVLKFGIEGKYNFSNLIGKEDGEKTKNYLSVSLGLYF